MTRRAGFTLVEVLVALAIFAMIASAGVGLLSFAIDNRLAVRDASERTAAFQRTRALMRADLGQAAPRRVRGADGAPQAAFELGGEALFAVTRRGWINPGEARRASMQRVEYRLVEGRLERRAPSRRPRTRRSSRRCCWRMWRAHRSRPFWTATPSPTGGRCRTGPCPMRCAST